jgi:ribonuclease P protein component
MQRLKTRPQFQAVLEAELVSKTSHFALHRLDVRVLSVTSNSSLFSASNSWIGAMTPKRWAKRAVTRNAIKRQIYTVCAKLDSVSSPAVYLVRLRREFSRTEFASASSAPLISAVRAELSALLQRFAAPT